MPKALKYADGTPVSNDWNRMMTTCFNGASNIVQAGGLACLEVGTSEEGLSGGGGGRWQETPLCFGGASDIMQAGRGIACLVAMR